MNGKDSSYDPVQYGYKNAGEGYIEIPLSPDCRLGNYVSEIFEVTRSDNDSPLYVIPDGCNDLLITFDGNRISSHISPSISEPFQFNFNKMEWIFGVRFLPGATYPFIEDPLNYNSEQAVEAELLMPGFSHIEDMMYESGSFARRFEIISSYLENRVDEYDSIENLLRYCMQRIIRTDGQITIAALAEETGYSDRYLRKIFEQHVGHSPKALSEIIRVQKALRYLETHTNESLSDTALKFGFSDQSHMNREFRKYLKFTSGSVLKDRDWITRLDTDTSRTFKK